MLLCSIGQQSNNAIDIRKGDSSIALTQHIQFLEDPTAKLTIDDVTALDTWTYLPSGEANRGLTQSAYWLRINLRNIEDQPLQRFLNIGDEVIYDLRLWQFTTNGLSAYQETGSKSHFENRVFHASNETLPLTLSAQEVTQLILRVENLRPTVLTTNLITDAVLLNQERHRTLKNGLFIGAMLMLILYNFAMGFRLSPLFLLHALFSISVLFLFTRPSGITWQFLWPGEGVLDVRMGPFAASLGLLSGLLFLNRYFDLNKLKPRLEKLTLVYAFIPLVTTTVMLGQPYQVTVSLVVPLLTIGIFLWMGLIGWAIYERLDGAFSYAASWGLVLLGGIVYASWLQGYSSSFFVASDIIKLSAVAQVAGLSISARRRVARSKELLANTDRAVQAVQKLDQVNQLNEVFRSLGHEFANPISAIQIAQQEIQSRLRRIHQLNQSVHGTQPPSKDLTELYQELDTLYGLHEASQDATERLGALRSVLNTQLKLQENKSDALCINEIVRDTLVQAAGHTAHLTLQLHLTENLPSMSGYKSHISHLILFCLIDTSNRIASVNGEAGGETKPSLTLMTNQATRRGIQGLEFSMIDSTGSFPEHNNRISNWKVSDFGDDKLIAELNHVLSKLILDSYGIEYTATIHRVTGECHQTLFLPLNSELSSQSVGI